MEFLCENRVVHSDESFANRIVYLVGGTFVRLEHPDSGSGILLILLLLLDTTTKHRYFCVILLYCVYNLLNESLRRKSKSKTQNLLMWHLPLSKKINNALEFFMVMKIYHKVTMSNIKNIPRQKALFENHMKIKKQQLRILSKKFN